MLVSRCHCANKAVCEGWAEPALLVTTKPEPCCWDSRVYYVPAPGITGQFCDRRLWFYSPCETESGQSRHIYQGHLPYDTGSARDCFWIEPADAPGYERPEDPFWDGQVSGIWGAAVESQQGVLGPLRPHFPGGPARAGSILRRFAGRRPKCCFQNLGRASLAEVQKFLRKEGLLRAGGYYAMSILVDGFRSWSLGFLR